MAGSQAQPPPPRVTPRRGTASVPPPPAALGPPLPSEAVSTVIRRAAELDATAGVAPGRHLDEAQLVEIGREVGVSADAIRRALAEHHAGLLDLGDPEATTVVGPRALVVERTLLGTMATVRPVVDGLLAGMVLECCRRTGTRSVWRPKAGLLAGVERGYRKLTRGRIPEGVTEVVVELVELRDADGGPVAVRVRLEAELRSLRRGLVTTTVGGLAAAGAGTVAAVGAALAIGDPLPLLGVPAAGALGAGSWWGSRAAYRRQLEEVELHLQGGLDRAHPVEGDTPAWGRAAGAPTGSGRRTAR